ncbi:hypothetical protein F442_20059 [Phytophthora nicotianae P10297]|uniref:Uncharacterized protein n=8 Tax=Phytophthora nicotianae TaxID=4792 RepID=V9E3E9_PHYNI|nr:hypothetical protein F443_20236 [Phytophthora nicotianae P1569]ETL80047.1 hypothetical protein L917_19418 [Phytophthora nicotianae]ETM33291.1 hypothetical protein L914_19453 [Phytophthora nicotianae]ETO61786.1 hypothetical protein F444_20252 [Phytophthora nicotianae P1976]ETP31037.1 hypothetical protein F442_20059 [Phytophthora nicotianae P10297]
MTSIFSAGQSISSIGKSMTAIARVEEHLATFMKKVIYFEKFFQRMGPNLPTCVMDTATLLFQRCYEYRDEIRDELESSVAYVADAGRWVVGMGDWNSKMEKRLNQISELVLLANTLLTEYAVTGQVGAEGCREDLDAYLQILSTTVTLKNAPVNGKGTSTAGSDGRPPVHVVRAQSTTAAEFSSEMSALGTEITGAFSEMFGSKEFARSTSSGTIGQTSRAQASARAEADNDAMNPFTDSYRRPVDPYAKGVSSAGASASSSVQSLPNGTSGGGAVPEYPLSDGDTPEGPLSPVSMGEYECLEIDSIPKYAAFKSSAQLARRQYTGNNSLAASMTSDGGRSVYSESSAEYNELFPLPSSTQAVSKSLSSLDTTTSVKKKPPVKPIMDMNYSYDFQCEAAHNPFLSPNTPGPMSPPEVPARVELQNLSSPAQQSRRSSSGHGPSSSSPALTPPPTIARADTNIQSTPDLSISTAATSAMRSAVREPVLQTVAPPPTLHEAIDFNQAQPQAHAVPISGQIASTQTWRDNSVQSHGVSEKDAAAQDYRDSDNEYDLFGASKS